MLHSRDSAVVPWAEKVGFTRYGVQAPGHDASRSVSHIRFAPDAPAKPPFTFAWLTTDVASDQVPYRSSSSDDEGEL